MGSETRTVSHPKVFFIIFLSLEKIKKIFNALSLGKNSAEGNYFLEKIITGDRIHANIFYFYDSCIEGLCCLPLEREIEEKVFKPAGRQIGAQAVAESSLRLA